MKRRRWRWWGDEEEEVEMVGDEEEGGEVSQIEYQGRSRNVEWGGMSSINMGLDYDSTVMLTCMLLFAAAKAIVDVGPDMPWQS